MSAGARAARRWAVVLKNSSAPPVAAVASAWAGLNGEPLADAARRTRAAKGILAEEATETEARGLAAGLEARGINALAMPANLLEELPAARPVGRVGLEAAGLRPARGGAPLPWKDLAVMAAAAFRQNLPGTLSDSPTPSEHAARLGLSILTGRPLVLRPEREPKRPAARSEVFFFLDLLWREPARRLRIDGQTFDYSCLGARMGPASAANFRRLLADIHRRAPQALPSSAARLLLEGKSPAADAEGSTELERESRWLLTLRALGLA